MKVVEVVDEEVWEDFALYFHPNNFLASWRWGDFNEALGHPTFKLGLYDNKKLIGVCLAIKVLAKMGTYLLCPSGPLLQKMKKESLFYFLDYLKELAAKEKCRFLRVRPLVEGSPENRELFAQFGFKNAPTHVHAQVSWLLDIEKSEEELLAGMRKTTRYLVRQAGRLGIAVEERSNKEGLSLLERLQEETARRHHFIPFSNKYLEKEFEVFGKENRIKILIAQKGNEVLAAAMVVFYGDSAFYHHSASKESRLPASYLLQWEAIRIAKVAGKKFYNFWGIAPTDSPKHPWTGLTSFKQGFGGFRLEYLQPFDLPLTMLYPLIYWFERIRRYTRGLG